MGYESRNVRAFSCPRSLVPGPKRIFLLLSASLFAIAGCAPDTITSDWRPIDPPMAAPEFTLPQLDGLSVSLSELRGRVVIMEFWATYCGPCRFSLPSLEVIYKKHRERGVTVLLINEGETAKLARAWAAKRFTAPILLDAQGIVGRRYGVQGLPRLFIINQGGALVYVHEGYGGGLERNLTLILDGLLTRATRDKGQGARETQDPSGCWSLVASV